MRTLRSTVLAALLLGSNLFAAELPYLTTQQLDIIPFLPAPVANGSAQDREQQAQVLAVQQAASAERIALANSDSVETVYAMYASIMGADFKPAKLPITSQVFERLGLTEDAVVDPVKAFFGRTRPYLANADIQALVVPSKTNSYPSGHTARSTMMAIVLSRMVPEKRVAIFERANDYAQSRVIGGMHYPNDLDAGRRAGSAMAATLLASPSFMADFEAARAELRKVLGM